MIRPMPFCPSLLPWKNDTPVQVRINSARIGPGGGFMPSGASYKARFRTTSFMASSNSAASTKPITGLNSNAFSTPIACAQSTPEVAESAGAIHWFASPTPMIEPISAWDELFGSPIAPGAQVPDDRRDQQGEDHGIAGTASDLQDQLDWQQGHDREGDRAAGCQHAEKVEGP